MGNETASWAEEVISSVQQSNVSECMDRLSEALDLQQEESLAHLKSLLPTLTLSQHQQANQLARGIAATVFSPALRNSVYQHTLIAIPIALDPILKVAQSGDAPLKLEGQYALQAAQAVAYGQGLVHGSLAMATTLVDLEWAMGLDFLQIRRLLLEILDGPIESGSFRLESLKSITTSNLAFDKKVYAWIGVHSIKGLAADEMTVAEELDLLKKIPPKGAVFDMHKHRADTFIEASLKQNNNLAVKSDAYFGLSWDKFVSMVSILDLRLSLKKALEGHAAGLKELRIARDNYALRIYGPNCNTLSLNYDLSNADQPEDVVVSMLGRLAQSKGAVLKLH